MRILLILPLLAACSYYPENDRTRGFSERTIEYRESVTFLSDSATLATAPNLRGQIGFVLPPGPLAESRAASLRAATGSPQAPWRADAEGELGRDEALVVLRRRMRIADACLGAAEPGRHASVPYTFRAAGGRESDDLLPAGCALDTAMLLQAENPDDLIQGRAHTPTAAGPVARAAERWLARGDAQPRPGQPRMPEARTGENEREPARPNEEGGSNPAAPAPAAPSSTAPAGLFR
jgi:hypothetical protein